MNRIGRILIVDDNASIHEDFRKVLGEQLTQSPILRHLEQKLFDAPAAGAGDWEARYEIDSAYQGEEALKMVEVAEQEQNPYSVVFMDVRMPPGLDGIETTRKIWDRFGEVEVVICTAYSDYSSDEIVQRLGVTDRLLLLKKPYDPIVVKQFAQTLVAKQRMARQIKAHVRSLEQIVSERTADLDQLVRQLSGANSELQSSLERQREAQAMVIQSSRLSALGEMAGGIAHEINNPLAIINGTASQLKRMVQAGRMTPEIAVNYADRIEQTSLRIAKIVKGLKAFARDGEQEPFMEVTVESLIEDTLGLCRERFLTNGVELAVDPVDRGMRLQCRPTQVTQVLINLLNNAFDAVCDLPEKWVRVQATTLDPHNLRITVTDSGSGIPEEVRKKLMQPFFTTKAVGKGTGLGLSISKGLVESHNGALTLDVTCGNTRFHVELPKVQQGKRVVT